MFVLSRGMHRITSSFGPRTYTNNGKQVRDNHKGVDLVLAPSSVSGVIAAEAGVVTKVRTNVKGKSAWFSAGNYVFIQHATGVETVYYHLEHGSVSVQVGDRVKKGEVIGFMGATGNVTGAHLHFEVRINGVQVDPEPYLNDTKKLIDPNVKNIQYKVHTKRHGWLPTVTNCNDTTSGYAGVYGTAIDGIQVWADGLDVKYRVHLKQTRTAKAEWLAWVDKAGKGSDGYAGIYGREIDGVQISVKGKDVQYRVYCGNRWLSWITGYGPGPSGYAGFYGRSISGIQIKLK